MGSPIPVPVSEADYLGRFLLGLYHARFFKKNDKIERDKVKQEFRSHTTKYPFECSHKEILTLLQKHQFVDSSKNIQNEAYIPVNMTTFLRYRDGLLNNLDKQQKRVIFESPVEEFKKDDNLEVDPNYKQELLQFKGNFEEDINKDFLLTSKGCFICQKNFSLESDYIEHVEYHNQESNFESLRSRNLMLNQLVQISYQICQNSTLLRFCIQSLRSNITIHKVVIVRSTSMLYPQETDTPYRLSPGEQKFFYIDCHTFEIGYEQPVVIVFEDDLSKSGHQRCIEQHHFMRMESFNVEISNALHVGIPKRGELVSKGALKDYFPPKDLKENDTLALCMKCPNLTEYLCKGRTINQENIEDIYKLLLQLEDTALLKLYGRLAQTKAFINWSGIYFSVLLTFDNAITLEEILREGDRILLTKSVGKNGSDTAKKTNDSGIKDDPKKSQKIFGYVERILNRRVFFIVKTSKSAIKLDKPYDIKFFPTRYHIILQYRALELLRKNLEVKKILFPEKQPFTNKAVKLSISPHNEHLGKNPEQLEAVERIVHHIDSAVPYIVFGPPGTGKTTTVVEAIYQLWKVNSTNKILVVGGSNACVDEIAIRLLKIFKKIDPYGKAMLRIYSSAQAQKAEVTDDSLIKISNLCHGYQFYPNLETVYMYRIVLATLSVAAKYVHGGIAKDNFSHVFVDECGAATEPEVIAALIGTVTQKTKVILAGDPKQLGPVLKSKTAEVLGLGVSLLERLMNLGCYQPKPGTNVYDRSRQMRLTKNYRSHPEILHMSNKLYYKGRLESFGKADTINWALKWYKLPHMGFPVIFHAIKGATEKLKSSTSLHNLAEVRIVMNYIKEMMYFGVSGRRMNQCDIGVVTPYKSQVNLIRTELDTRKWFDIEVGSVEKFQGQERPVIILSMVRSETQGLGFLVSPKRLNVSLTRAQAALIIIGNPDTLSLNPDFKYVVNYCRGKGGFVEETAPSLSVCNGSDGVAKKLENKSVSKQNLAQKKKDPSTIGKKPGVDHVTLNMGQSKTILSKTARRRRRRKIQKLEKSKNHLLKLNADKQSATKSNNSNTNQESNKKIVSGAKKKQVKSNIDKQSIIKSNIFKTNPEKSREKSEKGANSLVKLAPDKQNAIKTEQENLSKKVKRAKKAKKAIMARLQRKLKKSMNQNQEQSTAPKQ